MVEQLAPFAPLHRVIAPSAATWEAQKARMEVMIASCMLEWRVFKGKVLLEQSKNVGF